jgi:hypothetical protein
VLYILCIIYTIDSLLSCLLCIVSGIDNYIQINHTRSACRLAKAIHDAFFKDATINTTRLHIDSMGTTTLDRPTTSTQ